MKIDLPLEPNIPRRQWSQRFWYYPNNWKYKHVNMGRRWQYWTGRVKKSWNQPGIQND